MTPERWQQVKAILADAIERDDALQRAVFVESSCAGDPLLQQEVEALLVYAENPVDQPQHRHF
jgi:non-specific serine/threonine protein kinase/serine/threonine-protein kinase